MSKQLTDAIKTIDHLYTYVNEFLPADFIGANELLRILDQINKHADDDDSVVVPEWISVEDRLPETEDVDGLFELSKECAVLCQGEPEIAQWQFGKEDDKWESWYSRCYEDNIEKITHWMPLPEPPKESNDAD